MNKNHKEYIQYCVENHVCRYCGSKLESKLIEGFSNDRDVEHSVCMACSRIEYGTVPSIFKIADEWCENHMIGFDSLPIYKREYEKSKICDVLNFYEDEKNK